MDKNSVLFLVVGAILLGLMVTAMVVRGSEPLPDVQWEYKIVRLSIMSTDIEHDLNEYGKQGWEVVDWEDTRSTWFLLKRQL